MTPSFAPSTGPAASHPSPAPLDDAALRAFTKTGSGPRTTFPLVLVAVTVSVLSMSLDAVPRYSHDAFLAGLVLTVLLAFATGKVVDAFAGSPFRLVAALGLPTLFGALIGTVVQTLVLVDVGTSWSHAVRDLGGLVDTTKPIEWIAAGLVLGGVPALVVAGFLVVASRSIRRLTGNDASEDFGVAFTGFAGLLAAFGLVLVDGIGVPPLLFVALAAVVTIVTTLLVDGSRLRLLRKVYSGQGAGFDIVPADRFAKDPSLAPMVAKAGSASVLVRVDRGSYRAAAVEPVALLGETESDTLRPLLRRRAAAMAMLLAILALGGLSLLAHV